MNEWIGLLFLIFWIFLIGGIFLAIREPVRDDSAYWRGRAKRAEEEIARRTETNECPCDVCYHLTVDTVPKEWYDDALSKIDTLRGMLGNLTQRWYWYEFGIHDHRDDWTLEHAKRKHQKCKKVWVEVPKDE